MENIKMEKFAFESLIAEDPIKSKEALKKFIEENSQQFDFNHLNTSGAWLNMWKIIFTYLKAPEFSDVYPECLSAIRILSRDKTNLNDAITIDQFVYLMNISNIGEKNNNLKCSSESSIEALKCLCNLVYNSTKCQEMCLKSKVAEGIFNRIHTYKSGNVDHFVKFFDMKLLFLISALNVNVRSVICDQLNGVIYLIEILDYIIRESKSEQFSDNEMDLISEILKVLFNLTMRPTKKTDNCGIDEASEEIQNRRITVVLRYLLFRNGGTKEKETELVSNTINLLTNVPSHCFDELVTKIISDDPDLMFENCNFTAVFIILEFLKHQLALISNAVSQHELLSPVLTVLVKCVRCNSMLRRYIRSVILPPLIDVKKRPEEGTEIRNYLCRLLTTPATQVRDLTEELLFVICKENVGRMIKHTGYGNAAGLLANRGLLGGRSNPTCEYSSDSEDSDTEEYKQLQHGINPVLGCYEAPRPNPLDGMTEEQKEYEAMKLVNLMDQLHRQGVVQPCRINEDGRPVPVEHILELQDEIPQQQMDHKRKT